MAKRADNVTSLKATDGEEADATTKTPTAGATPPPRRRKRRGLGLLISLLVIAIIGYFGFNEFQARLTHVFEQDARIAGNLITISSRISGWVTALEIRESQAVAKGDILVNIDNRESKLAADRLRAQLEGLTAEQGRLQAERELAEAQINSRIGTRASEVNASKTSLESLRPQLELASSEYKRAVSLYANKVIPKRELDERRTTLQRLEGNLRTASAEFASSQAKLAESQAEQAQLKVFDGRLLVLTHKRTEMEAQWQSQLLDAKDRTIRAPVNSVIDRTFVEVGEYVTPGQRLVLLHDPREIWVEANIKETEIRPVKIEVDAYPDLDIGGKVMSIGHAATSEFALLPSPNPSGNFTKTTQRLRTLIAVDQHEGLLRPGMMVEVSIDVR
ncbi:MAG: membrane fusion protein (multidrug efflux system) [Gammaproteobacteria bacterium]